MKLRPDEPEVWCSTFCNRGHRMRTGRPIKHECRILPPSAMRAERDGDLAKAARIMRSTVTRHVRGR
jgi:hypothetical protein